MVTFEIKPGTARERAARERIGGGQAPGAGAEGERQGEVIPFARKASTGFPFAARFAVLNLIGLALVGAAWADDLLLKPYVSDKSGVSYLITALFLVGLACVARRDWQSVRWAGNALVYLGMVGTVLGLIITVSSLSADKAQSFDNFKTIVAAIYIGSGTALYTNLLACIGYLWLGTNAHLLARQEV